MTDEDLLKARVLAAIAAAPSPTRSAARRRGMALLIASIVVALAIFQAAGGLDHATGRPLRSTLVLCGGWALFSACLSWVALWRGRSTLGRSPGVVLLAALATPLVLIGWMHLFDGTYDAPFLRVGWRCLFYHLSMAALPLGSLLALRRGIEPRGPWALGAALGAVCGAWAGVLVDLWCPLTSLSHVLVGHALPIVILVGLGMIFGRSMLGVDP